MSGRRWLALLLAVAPGGGCFRTEPQTLDPDAISIVILLYAGDDSARMVVAHPHRPESDPPPQVTAGLVGGGWRVGFTDTTHGCEGWYVPVVCLSAQLPEPIREGATYELEGEGPKGSFTGRTVVPTAPQLMDPGDTVRIGRNTGSGDWFRIPIRYRTPPEVGRMWPVMFATFADDEENDSTPIRVRPVFLDVEGEVDTVSFPRRRGEAGMATGSLRLLGTGWNYANFIKWSRSFGISGEGVYGYFDGAARSRSIRVIVEEE